MKRVLVLLLAALSLAVLAPARAHAAPHTVSYDKYSLTVDGKRVFVWAGEFHYFRQPSPGLWRDTLEKIKAAGYNGVSLYFEWQYHSPKQGVYDFSGVRDVDQLLQIANDLGMYVITRPGPYINGELDAGGIADWALQDGPFRTSNPCTDNCPAYGSFSSQANDYMHHVDAIISKHLITNGGGTVIAYQLDNEASQTGSGTPAYMAGLAAQVRADGIDVPLFTNESRANVGNWLPTNPNATWNNWYTFNDYPVGLSCASTTTWNTGQDYENIVRNTFGQLNQPIVAAEFQGGAVSSWGGASFENCRQLTNGQFERVYYQSLLGNGSTIKSMYMFFGGTSWGWQPSGYTSYDYGAPITEGRQLPDKYQADKQLGVMTQSLPSLVKTDPVPAIGQTDTVATNVSPAASTTCTNGPGGAALTNCGAINITHRSNPDDGSQFYFVRHDDRRSTVDSTFKLPITTPDGSYSIPQAGTVELNGRDEKLVVANSALQSSHLVYSTSNFETSAALGDNDVALLWGPNGQTGETVLRYASQPAVEVLSGNVTPTWSNGDLRLNYVNTGLAEVRISGGGVAKPLLLLLGDDDTSKQFWTQFGASRVLEQGSALVRDSKVTGSTVALTGDTKAAGPLNVWAPSGVTSVTWNGAAVTATKNADGSLRGTLGGAPTVTLPALTNWTFHRETPESTVSFDDTSWTNATHTITNNTVKPAAGQPVLYADDYGFHKGDVWYRGHFSPSTAVSTITLGYQPGSYGIVEVWLNGVFLGSKVPTNANAATADFAVPAGTTVLTGDNVISVLVRTMNRTNAGAPRGLTSATLTGATAPIAWKLQGNQGGEDITDTVRGDENNGGLYGERAGWSLAGYPDGKWAATTLPASDSTPGVAWYRTSFALNVPAGTDSSIGINIDDVATKLYRATIFVNGWNLGHYINSVGPQHTFVLPNGILKTNGTNTVAIATITNDGSGAGLGKVSLVDLGTVASSLVVPDVTSPAYVAPTLSLTGALPSSAKVGQTIGGAIASLTVPADAAGTALAATIDWGDGTSSVGVISGGTVNGSHTYTAPYAYPVKVSLSDRYGDAVLASATRLVSVPAAVDGTIGGSVAATLSLTLGAPAQFAPFTPGVDKEYTATTGAVVTSTAGDATLSVSDPGHLTNGTFSLPEALRVDFSKASWTVPVSNDPVTITFRQHIGATDALRTGAYSKTLTFTLSTTTP